jgi:hypothetical protein
VVQSSLSREVQNVFLTTIAAGSTFFNNLSRQVFNRDEHLCVLHLGKVNLQLLSFYFPQDHYLEFIILLQNIIEHILFFNLHWANALIINLVCLVQDFPWKYLIMLISLVMNNKQWKLNLFSKLSFVFSSCFRSKCSNISDKIHVREKHCFYGQVFFYFKTLVRLLSLEQISRIYELFTVGGTVLHWVSWENREIICIDGRA